MDLIREATRLPELEYMFRHVLTQEAAYSTILHRRRRQFHLRVGEALEALFPERQAELAPTLARHFVEAGESGRALKYATLAGDEAFRLHAHTEAIEHYTQALEMARRLPASEVPTTRLLHLYRRRGRALEHSILFDEAVANYEAMEALAQERADAALALASLVARGTLYATPTPFFNPAQGRDVTTRALDLARSSGDRTTEAKILWIIMLANFFQGHIEAASRYGEEALALARELDDREQLGHTLNDLAFYVYRVKGEIERSLAAAEEARGIWRDLGNLPMLADNLVSSAFDYHFYAGEFQQALAMLAEARHISESVDNQWGLAYSSGALGGIYGEMGEADKAIPALEEALRLAAGGFEAMEAIGSGILAMLYYNLGATDLSIEYGQRAVTWARRRIPFWLAMTLGTLALAYIKKGEYDQAEAAIQEAEQARPPGEAYGFDEATEWARCELDLLHGEYARLIERIEAYS
ncbi:MAG: hypothetical protein ACRDIB_00430, partial [Ardenticatenaceae bacterium]